VTNLPPALRDHLFERLRERKITTEGSLSAQSVERVGARCSGRAVVKDFGSFKICGEGQFPKTFLLRDQSAKGSKL